MSQSKLLHRQSRRKIEPTLHQFSAYLYKNGSKGLRYKQIGFYIGIGYRKLVQDSRFTILLDGDGERNSSFTSGVNRLTRVLLIQDVQHSNLWGIARLQQNLELSEISTAKVSNERLTEFAGAFSSRVTSFRHWLNS